MKTHYPDDQETPLCGAKSKLWPTPRGVRQRDRSVKVMIVGDDVTCKNCQRLLPEWYIPRPMPEAIDEDDAAY